MHKGEVPAKRGVSKLTALLGVLLAGGAWIVYSNARSSQPAPASAVAPSPPPLEEAAVGANAEDAAAVPPAPEERTTRELQPPVKKQATTPSKGARPAQ
jgi:hypothetical protein